MANEIINNGEKNAWIKKPVLDAIKKISFVVDRFVGEMVYLKNKPESCFAIYDKKLNKVETCFKFSLDGREYIPNHTNLLISMGAVRVPRDIIDHGDTDKLMSAIKNFLDKYVYIEDPLFREIVVTYILLTWVYDRFSAIPYLRALGDYGTGKSRLLKTLNICYKSIYTSGNASAAPIFRLIDRYGGTLIIDEAELGRQNDRNEDIKDILRFGKDSDGFVIRCDPKTNEPFPYKVFGPKILGSRHSYSDDALESRIISIKMTEMPDEKIPIMLDKREFYKDSEQIRAMLVDWRLRNYFKIDVNAYKKFTLSGISKRLNEMYAPLFSIRKDDDDFISELMGKAAEQNDNLLADKAMSLEANIISAIYGYSNREFIPIKYIVEELDKDSNKKHHSRFIAGIVKNNLGLVTEHKREGTAIKYDKNKIIKLAKEYNLTSILEDIKDKDKNS